MSSCGDAVLLKTLAILICVILWWCSPVEDLGYSYSYVSSCGGAVLLKTLAILICVILWWCSLVEDLGYTYMCHLVVMQSC